MSLLLHNDITDIIEDLISKQMTETMPALRYLDGKFHRLACGNAIHVSFCLTTESIIPHVYKLHKSQFWSLIVSFGLFESIQCTVQAKWDVFQGHWTGGLRNCFSCFKLQDNHTQNTVSNAALLQQYKPAPLKTLLFVSVSDTNHFKSPLDFLPCIFRLNYNSCYRSIYIKTQLKTNYTSIFM